MRVQERQHSSPGFTLVELLVVIAIILLASLVAIPTLVTNLNGRQVTDAARIFTGSISGARDSAIRYNEPRGIRLLPDPVLTIPAPGQPGAGTTQLVYNRMIPIEPAGDYAEGRVNIGPQYYFNGTPTGFPGSYTSPSGTTYPYPYFESPKVSGVLMLEESPYFGGFSSPNAQPNSPTNWFWNVRVGDKIKIGGAGRSYTIVGPCTINPWATGANQGNPELFVNAGAPGTTSPLLRAYYPAPAGLAGPADLHPFATSNPQFLFLVNSEDDDGDGYVDEGWDGFDNNYDGVIDGFDEWEIEKWVGALTTDALLDVPAITPEGSPSANWVWVNYQKGTHDVSYVIQRRPVPSQSAREVMLPAGMVIDATTWNSTQERSRIPVSPGSLYCDIMVNQNGLYIPTTEYSTPTSANPLPFLHFWITDRNDVYPRGTVWGVGTTGPNANVNNTTTVRYYELPMTSDAIVGSIGAYPPTQNPTAPFLKNDRRLVTMFAQSGLVVTNTIESVVAPSALQPGEGFKTDDINYPYLKAQQGMREAR